MIFTNFMNKSFGHCPRCDSWITTKEERCAACEYLLTDRDKAAIRREARTQWKRGATLAVVVMSAVVAAALAAAYL